MNKNEIEKIVNYLVERGLETLKNNTNNEEYVLDYVDIFAKDEEEFEKIVALMNTLGEGKEAMPARRGINFLLKELMATSAGMLRIVKIRKPDSTRPQRGAPDFIVEDYTGFKNKYLKTSGNFTLMLRADYDMVEIKGVDVLVYIKEKLIKV